MLKLSRVLLSFILLFVGVMLFAQNQYDHALTSLDQFRSKGSAEIPIELKYAFRVDAARLSIRTEEDLSSQSVRISPTQSNLYYRILTAIYESDEIGKEIAACGIHTSKNLSVDYAELVYNRGMDWAKPLQEGIASTDHPVINRLMEEYDLIIQSYRQLDAQNNALVIRAAEPINMAALSNLLSEVEGVVKVNLGTDLKSTSDIQIAPISDGWDVSYLLYFEENGIKQQHRWIFHVNEKWEVEFLNESGAPVPEDLSCR